MMEIVEAFILVEINVISALISFCVFCNSYRSGLLCIILIGSFSSLWSVPMLCLIGGNGRKNVKKLKVEEKDVRKKT